MKKNCRHRLVRIICLVMLVGLAATVITLRTSNSATLRSTTLTNNLDHEIISSKNLVFLSPAIAHLSLPETCIVEKAVAEGSPIIEKAQEAKGISASPAGSEQKEIVTFGRAFEEWWGEPCSFNGYVLFPPGFGINAYDGRSVLHADLVSGVHELSFEKSPTDPEWEGSAICFETASREDEIIVARLTPKKTLRKTVDIIESRRKQNSDFLSLTTGTSLFIPNIEFSARETGTDHRESAHTGEIVQDCDIGAEQEAEDCVFTLDRNGIALLRRKSTRHVRRGRSSLPSFYVHSGPLLIYAKNKKSSSPFLAMWIADCEILQGNEE